MKFFYLRNKETGNIVTFISNCNDEGDWVELDYDYSQPYFSDKELLKRIVDSEQKSTWSIEISSSVLKDVAAGFLEVCEVNL